MPHDAPRAVAANDNAASGQPAPAPAAPAGAAAEARHGPPRVLSRTYLKDRLETAILNPVRAFRIEYAPLLMIYFAYGALGLTAIAEAFWVRKQLSLTPAELATLAVWLALPWTIKMVFGELVDSVPILGSQRRAYVYIGAALVAAGLGMLAATAAGWLTSLALETSYRIASFLVVVGVVMQDVVADAMTTEVVPRNNPDGSPRPKEDVDRDLGMVQVLGRLAVSAGSFTVAGLAGALAGAYSYATVFALGLLIPLISVSGAAMVRIEPLEQRPVDWTILGGGLAFGALVTLMAGTGLAYGQEIIFVVSMAVVCTMLRRVVGDVDADTRRKIFFATLLIFVFRSMPSVGQGYSWFTMDVLGFDERFQGVLAQIGTGLALIGMWLFSDAITRKPVTVVLLWLTVVLALLSLPNLGLTLGLHEWTEQHLGIGARTIAIVDTAADSPFLPLSMIPLLTLIAIYAPEGRRASWFALMASLMNLALVASALLTKYLNEAIVIARGDYARLPRLLAITMTIGLVVPLLTILAIGKRVR